MGVPAVAGGKPQPEELVVQAEAEETSQRREVGVEVDPGTVQPTTNCISVLSDPTDPHRQ